MRHLRRSLVVWIDSPGLFQLRRKRIWRQQAVGTFGDLRSECLRAPVRSEYGTTHHAAEPDRGACTAGCRAAARC